MIKKTYTRRVACVITLCIFSVASAQTSTTVINDSFADGITNNGAGQLGWWTTSSSSALDQAQAGGPVDFATGSSGRGIHATFPIQTLTNAGDKLEVSFSFTVPTTVAGANNEALKFGLFDTSFTNDPATGLSGPAVFNMDIPSSSGATNPLLNVLPGFAAEIDDINAQTNASVGTSDIIIRTHNVTNDTSGLASAPTGRLLTTTGGFDNIGSATDDQFLLNPNTDYSVSYSVALNASGDFDLEVGVFDAAGLQIGTHTDTAILSTVAGTEVGLNTSKFDLIALYASGGAFGSTNGTGEADNGIDINNVTVVFSTVPEPGSLILLMVAGLGSLGFVRSRRRK